jgi:hypothetical protein
MYKFLPILGKNRTFVPYFGKVVQLKYLNIHAK